MLSKPETHAAKPPLNLQLTEAFAKEIELDKMRMDLASSSSLVGPGRAQPVMLMQ